MALNTSPLTSTRRIVMLGVLFGLFLGSLALAAGLVRLRQSPISVRSHRQIAYEYAPLPGFVQDTSQTPAARDAEIALRGRVGGAGTVGEPRLFYVFRASKGAVPAHAALRDVVNIFCNDYLKIGNGADGTIQYAAAKLGGQPAVEALVRLSDSGVFARLRVAQFDDQYIALMYIGGTAMTPQDEALWTRVSNSFKVHGLGQPAP